METGNHDISQDDIDFVVTQQNVYDQAAINELDIDILVKNKKAGNIEALIIERGNIPKGAFLYEMDACSAETQWIGSVLFEPKAGRTKLKSLLEHDNHRNPFMYIKKLTVSPTYHMGGNNSDVGAFAIRKLLHYPAVSRMQVTTAIYVLDGVEVMTEAENKEYKAYQKLRMGRYGTELTEEEKATKSKHMKKIPLLHRKDANQFLRNGFFQDEAYARDGDPQDKILVASSHHWKKDLMSHDDAEKVEFCGLESKDDPRSAVDLELLKYVEKDCSDNAMDLMAAMFGIEVQDNKVREDTIKKFISSGASIVKSHCLHVAVAKNSYNMVKLLLEFDHTAIDAFDDLGSTPLMVAAISACGRSTNKEINDMKVVELLIAKGANRDLCNKTGMTAYGNFLHARKEMTMALNTMMGKPADAPFSFPQSESEGRMMGILEPTDGPTVADMQGGITDGMVQYYNSDGDYFDDDEDDDNDDYEFNSEDYGEGDEYVTDEDDEGNDMDVE